MVYPATGYVYTGVIKKNRKNLRQMKSGMQFSAVPVSALHLLAGTCGPLRRLQADLRWSGKSRASESALKKPYSQHFFPFKATDAYGCPCIKTCSASACR